MEDDKQTKQFNRGRKGGESMSKLQKLIQKPCPEKDSLTDWNNSSDMNQ